MFLKWHVYPYNGQITDEQFGRLPYPPYERFGNYVSYLSPVWDADLQQYVDQYVYQFIGWKTQFEEAFNCHCNHDLEVHGAGQYCFSNRWLREFMNCNGQIILCPS